MNNKSFVFTASSIRYTINLETPVLWGLFLVSLINKNALLVATALICIFLPIYNKATTGALKALVFITVRSIINPGIASGFEEYGTIKWAMVFVLSFIMFFRQRTRTQDSYNKTFVKMLLLFFTLLIIHSFIFSGYPIVSSFKSVSWAFVFYSVIIAVNDDPDFNWADYICKYLNIIVLFTPLALIMGVAYLRNGHALQGVINHPNMFGIVTALSVALNIYAIQKGQSAIRIIMIVLTLICCVLSESRTGVLSILICAILYVSYSSLPRWKKLLFIVNASLVSVIILLTDFSSTVWEFLYKGHASRGILYSRLGQIDANMYKFNQNKLFGSGFMVPYKLGGQDFSFSFDLLVEPGNMVISLLGDIGIIGTFLFIILYISMFVKMEKRKAILFFPPFVISLGEMVFFSTNSIAVLLYIMLAICLTKDSPQKNRSFN